MDCKDREEQLSAYIDGELPPEEKAGVEAHIEDCTQCRHALEELKQTVSHLQNVENVEPPAWLQQKVMANVRAETESQQGFWTRLISPMNLKVSLPALATIAIAVTAFLVFRSIEPDIPQEPSLSETVTESKEELKKEPAPHVDEEQPAKVKSLRKMDPTKGQTSPSVKGGAAPKSRGISKYESRKMGKQPVPGRMAAPESIRREREFMDYQGRQEAIDAVGNAVLQDAVPEKRASYPSAQVSLRYRADDAEPGALEEGAVRSLLSPAEMQDTSPGEEASFEINLTPHLIRSMSDHEVQYRVVIEPGTFRYLNTLAISPEERSALQNELDDFVRAVSNWEQVLTSEEVFLLKEGSQLTIHVTEPFQILRKFEGAEVTFPLTWNESLERTEQ